MPADFTGILSVIIIFQLLFLFVFLVTYSKGKRLSNILLAFFFLSVCLNFLDGILVMKNAYYNHPSFAFIGNNFSLLFGPLLYLYTKSVIYKDFRLKSHAIIHATPFLTLLAFATLSYYTQTTGMKRYILESARKQEYPVAVYLISAVIYVQFFCYSFASLKKIKAYRATIANHFSEVHRINLDWLTTTIILFMIVIAVGIVNAMSVFSVFKDVSGFSLGLIIVALFFYINRLLFKALRQPGIFKGISQEDQTGVSLNMEKPVAPETQEFAKATLGTRAKYAGSTLTQAEKEAIKQQLISHMQLQKPYLEPELNLEELASQINVKPKTLSQVINECLHQNFFDFVNRYRIEEARRLLSDPSGKKVTVLEVLYEVSFNSKSSFNTLFKKYTGITPSEFRKKQIPV